MALKPIVNGLKSDFIAYNQNNTLEVLVEEKTSDQWVGYSKNYIRCYISSNKDLTNKVVKVKVIKPYKDGAIAELIED